MDLLLVFQTARLTSCHVDILLHESGHIMLSDFDLSKPTNEPGGAPAVMKQSAQGGVSRICAV